MNFKLAFMKEKMKWLLFSVLASSFLLSCGKDDIQNHGGESKQVQLELSAVYNPEAAQDQQALAMDLKDEAGRVKASLDGKTTVPVFTYIYMRSSPIRIFGERLNWKVQPDKKTLKYEGQISLSAATVTSASDLRVVAVIADGNDLATAHKFDITSSYANGGTAQVFSATTPTTINVPYVLEANLKKGIHGALETNQADQKIFKPYGHILRVKITNKTGKKIAVKGISSNKLLAKGATLAVLPGAEKILTREEEPNRIDLTLSEKIEIENGQVANKHILLWVPKMNATGTYRLDLMVEGVDPTRLYTMISPPTKLPSQLKNGKIYNLNVEVYKTIINPLSLLSDDVLNSYGTDFVNLRNTFQIDDLNTYNGPGKVGYFGLSDAINRFCDEKTYPSTGTTLWHLPDFFEWNSIFYNPEKGAARSGYIDVYDGAWQVKVGVGTKSSDGNPSNYYWRTVGYQVHVPAAAMSTYVDQRGQTIPTIETGHSYYILSFAKAGTSSDARFPVETTNYNRFAFRYTLKEDRIEITCAPVGIQSIGVKDLPDHLVFSGISAVHRTIPFYGISNEAPFTRKDNMYGNRRIIDYATNTTTLNHPSHPNGTGIVAAFSAPRNLVVPYAPPHHFPVALFKKAIED